MGDRDRLRLVRHRHIHHTVRLLHRERPDLLRLKVPSPPPSIIAGPPIPILASGDAITRSQQPSSAALPARTAAGGDRPAARAR